MMVDKSTIDFIGLGAQKAETTNYHFTFIN